MRASRADRHGERAPRRALRHTWLIAVAPLLATGLLAIGCGAGVTAPDLFVVQRTGSGPGARLTLLVNEEGGVRCNGSKTLKLSDPQIVQARAIQEDLKSPAGKRLALQPRAGSVLSYSVRDENGTVRFSDNSAHQPAVFRRLQLFVLQVAQQVCHLAE
jgi:hypothetical protein